MWIAIGVAGGIVVIGYIWYVSIIGRRNKAQEAFSGIDVQLKKRHDLIPNILTIAKRFMEHERGLLEDITRLRAQALEAVGRPDAAAAPEAAKQLFEIEAALQGRMGQLMVAVENYPDLKSDQTMLQAQRSYNEVEANIAAARRFYNSAVTALRNAIQVFPGSMIAGMAGVGDMPLFQAADTDRQPVDAEKFLG